MTLFKHLAAIVTAIWLVAHPSQATEIDGSGASCSVLVDEDKSFSCQPARSSGLLAAMAAQETRDHISELGGGHTFFDAPMEREIFRKSLERNWRHVQRHVNRQLRAMKRRRLSQEDYLAVVDQYQSARQTYDLAMRFYRGPTWFSAKPSRFAEGEELIVTPRNDPPQADPEDALRSPTPNQN